MADLCGVCFAGSELASTVPPAVSCAIVARATAPDSLPTLEVRGPWSRTSRFERSGLSWSVGAELRVGQAHALLGAPLASLANVHVELDHLWPCDFLREALARPQSMNERLALLEAELGRRLARARLLEPTSRLVPRAIQLLDAAPDRSVAAIACELGLGPRQLRRHFNDLVGIGPKEYAAIRRFERAADGLARGRPLAQVALEAGYYDQSHMNLDFRARAGMSPKSWASAAT